MTSNFIKIYKKSDQILNEDSSCANKNKVVIRGETDLGDHSSVHTENEGDNIFDDVSFTMRMVSYVFKILE